MRVCVYVEREAAYNANRDNGHVHALVVAGDRVESAMRGEDLLGTVGIHALGN